MRSVIDGVHQLLRTCEWMSEQPGSDFSASAPFADIETVYVLVGDWER